MSDHRLDTPLAEQLGLKRGMRCWFHNMPDRVRAAIDPDRAAIEEQSAASDGMQCAHLFVTSPAQLARELAALSPLMATQGFIWISWPGPDAAAAGALDATEVERAAAAHGLAADRRCTLDADWAAARFVRPRTP